jgi:hypothetical protein
VRCGSECDVAKGSTGDVDRFVEGGAAPNLAGDWAGLGQWWNGGAAVSPLFGARAGIQYHLFPVSSRLPGLGLN